MRLIKLIATLGLVGSLGACVVHERSYGHARYRGHHHGHETATVIIHRH